MNWHDEYEHEEQKSDVITVSYYSSGGDDGIRTHDLYVANVPLSHLSYIPTLHVNLHQGTLFFNGYVFI
jgi:hypothetical protein